MRDVGAADLSALLAAARGVVSAPARLYLVASTSHLAEGWRPRVPHFEIAGDPAAPESLEVAVRDAAASLGIGVVWESPADVIPLPSGWQERARAVPPEICRATQTPGVGAHAAKGAGGVLDVVHFDPYSVVLRLVARGDEPDYVAALEYVRHGWVEPARLDALHAEVVPRFTFRTLAQDPAEFRRKFSGLRQLMARHLASGSRAAHTMADTGMSWL